MDVRARAKATEPKRSRSKGLKNWVSPELEFVQSHLAATLPYARAAELLALLLPVDTGKKQPSSILSRLVSCFDRGLARIKLFGLNGIA